jgi:DNA-binding GntR family transcriptional regulator
MVEQAAEAIVAGASRGIFLPGDRLVEAEIARDLGISRVPVREALRLLESQGIVVSTPYKGMRLMQVTNRGVGALMRVRQALETLAIQEALGQPGGPERFQHVRRAAAAYETAVRGPDPALRVAADEQFHAELCRASGNPSLLSLWLNMSRQLAVVWGLMVQDDDLTGPDRQHFALLEALERGDESDARAALFTHLGSLQGRDYEAMVADRRRSLAS